MSFRFIPIVVGVMVAGAAAQAQSTDGGRNYDPSTIWGFTHFGEAGYRYSGDAPSSGKIRLLTDFYTGKFGFGVTGGGQVQFFDSDKWNSSKGNMTIWEGDAHAYYEFPKMFTVGGYYAYEGSNDVNDFQYYGGEAMFTMRGFNIDAKLGLADNADGDGHGTAYEISGFYDISDMWSVGAGYGRIDSNDFDDYQRAFGRVSYSGIIRDNGIGLFAELSYVDADHGDDDTSISAGLEWGFGRSAQVKRRPFRKPITKFDF